jgi:hypothetical protein
MDPLPVNHDYLTVLQKEYNPARPLANSKVAHQGSRQLVSIS